MQVDDDAEKEIGAFPGGPSGAMVVFLRRDAPWNPGDRAYLPHAVARKLVSQGVAKYAEGD